MSDHKAQQNAEFRSVLLTRPLAQSRRTAERLLKDGFFSPVIAPVLRIVALPWSLPVTAPSGLVLTSVNATEALSGFSRQIPVFAVGKATAEAASLQGFTKVLSADGNATALADLIKRTIPPETGVLFHLSGQDIAVDLQAVLGADGYHLIRKIVYRAEDVQTLPTEIHQMIAEGTVIAALAYSPHSARCLSAALTDEERAQLVLVTLSTAVSAAAGEGWKSCLTAEYPSEESLLKTLYGLADSV